MAARRAGARAGEYVLTGRTSTPRATVGHPTGSMNCMAVCVGHGGPAGGGDGQFQGKPLIDDPMESIVEAQVSMLEWHMQSRKFGMTAVQLELLQQKSIEVLESFKSTLPGVSLKKTVLPMAGNSKRPIAFYTRCVS